MENANRIVSRHCAQTDDRNINRAITRMWPSAQSSIHSANVVQGGGYLIKSLECSRFAADRNSEHFVTVFVPALLIIIYVKLESTTMTEDSTRVKRRHRFAVHISVAATVRAAQPIVVIGVLHMTGF